MRRRLFLMAVALSVTSNIVWAGDTTKNTAIHLGGTIGLFSGMPGTLTADGDGLVFSPTSRAVSVRIAYDAITAIEYGPQPSQRVPVAVLASKNRNAQYLTVNWMDNGKEQAVVFDMSLSKDSASATLATLEAKSGKSVGHAAPADSRHAAGTR